MDKPEAFLNKPLVITEKLDGSNTLLHQGNVYGRNGTSVSHFPWYSMVWKHHAWKTNYQGSEWLTASAYLYGEDIYGVHSIQYDPVPENATFYAFALVCSQRHLPYEYLEAIRDEFDIPIVPLLYRGAFSTTEEMSAKISEFHSQPSVLGGEREGVVIKVDAPFYIKDFASNVCKSVRVDHVQVDAVHWRRNWKPCQLTR